MDFETLRYEIDAGVATITLARPEKLNAIDGHAVRELTTAFDRADRDDDVRAVILTGEGRVFCAGADMSRGDETFKAPDAASRTVPEGETVYQQQWAREPGGILALRLYAMTKPLIAAINGPCAGMGATMPLPMDVRLASETARFGFVFARRGMVPEVGSSWFLPRIVGISRALEWCYSGRSVGADEALAAGLVSRVLPPEDLLPEARKLARELTENSAPVSIALTRQMMWRGLGMTHPMEAHRVESRGIYARGRSPDALEGVRAFLDKRTPVFPGTVSSDMPDYYPWWTEPEYF
ncbi:crotonase/enoyl-CoA hydratase family protein [Novosphingobium sp. JCM 18896]|uniref:crotonase/enoyl-CoA hydratase family protein n=1 Tax=Novosphingobium sp. JCM 18896 TaxID=2989731 RepID=UPI002222614D|nr:crotonase/enoyl-CoA hydratase family protein [Novosphingobium sp. JCM 18896]MCW1428344.1 crotonase/enoyl-CoA hydratase family protein [Novosphingobium sp. JCM 18896]